MNPQLRQFLALFLLILVLFIAGCAPGNVRFDKKPAGFWAGLWHGLISLFTFVISLFSKTVTVYETANTGGWYNFGFILGIAVFYGGSCKSRKAKFGKKICSEKDWGEIGAGIEEKIKKGIKSWLDESDKKGKEWRDIAAKIEKKIKNELRDWANK